MSDPAIHSTTQEFLDVYDIVNDMVLLKDGTASIILRIGTMNFSLLAEQEQDAVIFTYGSLLNSLNYPIQISIQSQTKDATKYLRLLDDQIEKTTSDRKAILIKKYRNFVAQLIKERNVLEKKFYIIVPTSPSEMGLMAPSSVLPGKTAFDITTVEKSILLEKAANILEPRHDHLTAQFNRLGLFVSRLNTQEIIQNFYINYNPEAAEGQEIAGSDSYTTPMVRASFGKSMLGQTIQDTQAQMQQQSLQQTSPPQEPAQQTQTKEDLLQEIPVDEPPIEQDLIQEAAPIQSSAANLEITQLDQVEAFPPESNLDAQSQISSQEQVLFSAPKDDVLTELRQEITTNLDTRFDNNDDKQLITPVQIDLTLDPSLLKDTSQLNQSRFLESSPLTEQFINHNIENQSILNQPTLDQLAMDQTTSSQLTIESTTQTESPTTQDLAQDSTSSFSQETSVAPVDFDFSEDITPLNDSGTPEPPLASESPIPVPANIFTDSEEDLTKSN